MTHQKYLFDAESIKKPDEVADDMEGGVGRSRGRGVCVAISAKVRGDGTVAKGGEIEKLMTPAIPKLREAVE